MARTVGKTLGWIAAAGLGAGVVFLALAFAVGGRDLDGLLDRPFASRSCGKADGKPEAERRLAWTGGDKIDIAGSATVRYRGVN